VGKTTTAINLAAYLADAGRSTLVIDMSPNADTTSGLGVDAHRVGNSIYEVLVTDETALSDIIKTDEKRPHLALAPAKVDLYAADIELIYLEDRERRLSNAVAPIKDRYDYILIDCPSGLNILTVNALTAADGVILPLQCEYNALEGMQMLLNTIKLVRDRLNPQIALFGVVLTMYDPRTNLGQEVVREVRGHFAKEVFPTMIPRSVRLAEAPSYGLTILEHEARSPGALAYKALAEEVIARAEAAVTSTWSTAGPSVSSARAPRAPAPGAAPADAANQQELAGPAAAPGATSTETTEARLARLEQRVNQLREDVNKIKAAHDQGIILLAEQRTTRWQDEPDAVEARVTRLEEKLAVALDYTEWVVAFLGRKEEEEEEQKKKAATP
jgi:chromosome partitioning protein